MQTYKYLHKGTLPIIYEAFSTFKELKVNWDAGYFILDSLK
jgi:hypothetical protein